ncbi:hypothetical protein [Actinocorallia aurantiaca]|uniref:hypothetical protein n=1 Tax=Actinocorallia aurantiaca TaxID=46204 RepID=UPI0031DE6E46
MAGREKKQKKTDAQKKAEAARKARTAQRAHTVRRARRQERPAPSASPSPAPASGASRWVSVVLVRFLAVAIAGYLAALSATVSFFSGAFLLTEESRPFSGAAMIAGGALAVPLLLYYGAAKLTARSSELTRTPQDRLRWSLLAYVLTALLTVLSDFQFAPFPLAVLPAALIVGKRTFRTALIACPLLACLVLALW